MGIFRIPLIGTLWTMDAVKGLEIKLKCRNWLDEIVENPPDCNLVYTLRSFQPFTEVFPEEQFHFIGPSVYDRKEEDFPVLAKPVIYISIGTILKGGENFFRACLEAFEKEKVTVVLSVGNFDISRLKHIPENFVIRNRIPQIAVLKQAALFITHGGMNSVSEAMTCGVPMVVIPFTSDQPVNAKQVERLNLGRILPPKSVTAESLKAAAQTVIEDETILKAVAEMQKTIAQAPGNAGAVAIIESFLLSTQRRLAPEESCDKLTSERK
jgi:MGT family glycosyltransferase